MDSIFLQGLLGLATFQVLVTLFFALQLSFLDNLGVLQESANKFAEQRQPLPIRTTFDYIIVGGGAAGCVLANRLSSNPKNQVLLLERGGDPNPLTQIPVLFQTNFGTASPSIVTLYNTTNQTFSCGASNGICRIGAGTNLGGGTNVNVLVNTRGSPQIFDSWAKLTRDEIWKYENVLPFFKMSEDYHGYYEPINTTYHSTGGDWYVGNSDSSNPSPAADYFFQAAERAGYPLVDINNGAEAKTGGYAHLDFNVKQGVRWSTFKAFLQPILARPNLRVSRYARVTKINFDSDKRATGVSYVRNGQTLEAHAQNEIILSAGSFGSAQLLMLSGIGPKLELEAIGIPSLVDLPVGKFLVDHMAVPTIFSLNTKLFFYPQRDTSPTDLLNYVTNQTGPFVNPFSEVGVIFARSSVARRWKNSPPDLELIFGSLVLAPPPSLDDGKDYFMTLPFALTPKSVGSLKLVNNDPLEAPLFNPNYATHPDDMKVLLEGIKLGAQLVESSPELKAAGLELVPLPACNQFRLRSSAFWICYIKNMGRSADHVIGTCRMGVNSKTAVVDSKLKVFGVRGLRVVDASVMPVIPNAHTTAATVMIGQVGSSLILHDGRA